MVNLNNREVTAEIIEACRRGDRDAFRALYETYKDRVYSIALYYFHGDASAAGDVTQQVFLKLMTAIAQFRGEAGFSTWLYRMVVNACTDVSRRRKPTVEPSVIDQHAAPGSQEEDFTQSQTASAVRDAVAGLPDRFRIAVLLRYFDELSYEEMAKVLQCSAGTVASRLSRGHKLLAERLKGFK